MFNLFVHHNFKLMILSTKSLKFQFAKSSHLFKFMIAPVVNFADPSQCNDIINNGGLQTVSMAMESFPSSTKLQVVAMAAVGVVLGVVKEARLLLISEYRHVLDMVFQSMQIYPSEAQIQQYACSLLALLIAEGEMRVRERKRERGRDIVT